MKSGWEGLRLTERSWWPHLKRGLTVAFFALIAWLLIEQARTIDWSEVLRALGRLPKTTLLIAAGLAAASYAVYTTFDLIGRRYTGHSLSTAQVLLVAFISYAFNLNLGSLVGGVAFRYRLYAKLGLDNGVITRVLSVSMLTNWLGYFVLGGVLLCFFEPPLPARWRSEAALVPWIGAILLAVAGAYVLACAFAKQRQWKFRSHAITLPSARMALLQMTLAVLNWMIIAGIVFTLFQARIEYPLVLTTLLMGAVAGVVTHVPAGVGVLEAVFVAMLSRELPSTQLLAGLLGYRAVYYLLPLALAALLLTRIEWATRSASR